MHNANHHQQEDNIGEVVNIRTDSCCGAISLSSSQRERHFLRRKRSFIPGCRYCHLIAKIYGILDEGKGRARLVPIIQDHQHYYPTLSNNIIIHHYRTPRLSNIIQDHQHYYPTLSIISIALWLGLFIYYVINFWVLLDQQHICLGKAFNGKQHIQSSKHWAGPPLAI